jgi:translocation and assembly module TamB
MVGGSTVKTKIRRFLSRRFVIFTLMIAGSAFALGTVLSQTIPKLKSWMLVTIDQFSRDNLPVRILPGTVEFRLFPLGVTLNDVRILPTKDFEKILSPLTVQEVSADLTIFKIIRGEVSLDEVAVRGTVLRLTIPPSKNKGGKPLEGLFKELDRAPIRSIVFSDISATIEIPQDELTLDVDHLNLNIKRSRARLDGTLTADSIVLKDRKEKRALRMQPEFELAMTPTTVEIERLDLRRGTSLISTQGSLKGDTEALDFQEGELAMNLDLDVKSTRDWLQKSFKDAEPTPPMSGRLKAQLALTKLVGKAWKAGLNLNTTDFRVEGILLDKIRAKGMWDGTQFQLPLATSESRAGKLEIQDLKIGEGSEKTPEGRTPWLMRIGKIKGGLELHEFLTDMGIGPIPVWLSAQGEFPCESRLVPKFFLRCGGTFSGQNVVVQGDLSRGRVPKGSIVAIPEFSSKGDFTFDLDKFSYNAEITMPNSTGRSSGNVHYKTGFDIKYEADKLAIKDLSSLGDLKLLGSLKLKGSTSGNSQSASLTMDAEGQDLWLEDFWLGQPKGAVSYKSGKLSFINMQGYYTTSRYSGDVAINFGGKGQSSTIETNLKVPFFDARDLLKVFSKKFKLPVAVTGTGQASIKANGPLDISHMTYDLKSSLFKGTIAGESFEQVHFDVKSKAGEVKSERVLLTRGDSIIQLTGVGHPNGNVETEIRGRGLHLEETNFISESGFALAGLLGFDMTLNGPVLAPDAQMKGTLSRTSIAETAVPDSQFELQFTSKTVEGKGSFLGDLLTGNFVWPLTSEAPMSIQFSSNDWNYAPVFAAFAGPTGRRDFEGRLTAKIDLKAAQGGFWKANGTAVVDKLSLRRGAIELVNERPLRAEAREGSISIKDFELKGDGTFIKIADRTGADAPARKVDIQINSKIDMNLLTIFTPFFEEMRGLLSMAIAYKQGPEGSDIIGSAYIDRAFLKFAAFPHAFENLQSDIVFNHRKVVINTLKSDFAGGKIQAVGGLEIKGKHQIPVNVNGTFEKITLNIPDKIRTSGSGDFTFSGAWFPFLLKGNYVVKDGLMSKELGDAGTGDADNLRRDQFLPRFLVEESFQPLVLDLAVDFSKSIQLKNKMIEGAAAGKLQVSGIPTKPTISGQIRTLPETRINFRENLFDVSSALLSFEDPLEINPRINLQARSRVDSYDVNLLVQGTAKKPEISVSSIPPMPERDILSLLALGTTDQQLSPNATTATGSQNNGAGAQVLSGVANEALKNVTGDIVDVQLSTGFDASNESYQKVVIKKKITRKLESSYSQAVGNRSGTEAKIRYRVTDRVSGVASWVAADRAEATDAAIQQSPNQNKVGLDFEYKFEFK